MQLKHSDRDLGVDTSAGRCRRVKVHRGRWLKAEQRGRKTAHLARVNRKAGVLAKTGALPQARWGIIGMGAPLGRLKQLRGLMMGADGTTILVGFLLSLLKVYSHFSIS